MKLENEHITIIVRGWLHAKGNGRYKAKDIVKGLDKAYGSFNRERMMANGNVYYALRALKKNPPEWLNTIPTRGGRITVYEVNLANGRR